MPEISSNDKSKTSRKFSCFTNFTAKSEKQTFFAIIYSTDNFQDKRSHLESKKKNHLKSVNSSKYNTLSAEKYYCLDTNKWSVSLLLENLLT